MAPTSASSLVLVALLAGRAVDGRSFIFDASRCNTNWDDAANWEGAAIPTITSLVSFGASSREAGSAIEPVNLLIKTGAYSVGGFTLPRDGATITLSRDNAVISMAVGNTTMEGPPSFFTGGQTDKPECAFGCADNWKMGNAGQASYFALQTAALATLPTANTIPGPADMVIIPFGYNPKISAWGQHQLLSFGWYSTNDTYKSAQSKSAVPAGFTVPAGNQLDLFFDNDEAMFRCNGACSTESRCPAWTGTPADDLNMPFEQAARIRTSTASNAASAVISGTVQTMNQFVYTFGGLGEFSGLEGAAAQQDCPGLAAALTTDAYYAPLAPLASYDAADNTYDIDATTATASMRLWSTGANHDEPRTTTMVTVTGVAVDGLVFKAHLHSQPCAEDGGGHYMNNPAGAVDADNENWPMLTCDNTTCTGEATSMWFPTADALAAGMSIVIHDTPAAESGSGSKYLCADLNIVTSNVGSTVAPELLPMAGSVTDVDVSYGSGSITVTGMIAGSVFHMNSVQTDLTAAPFNAANRPGPVEGRAFYAIFDGIASHFDLAFCSSVSNTRSVADIKEAAGLVEQTLTVFAGSLSPQIDLPYMVLGENGVTLSNALTAGLTGSNGMLNVNAFILNEAPSMTIVSTAGQAQVMREQNMLDRSRRATLMHLDMVNYNTAQARIQLNFDFRAYGMFYGTSAAAAVRTLADVIIANTEIEWPATDNCLTMPAGYDWACVTTQINSTVEAAMARPDAGSECETDYSSEACKADVTRAAAVTWDNMFACGPAGMHVDGVSGCVDPMYSSSGALFTAAVTPAIIGQEADILSANAAAAGDEEDDGFLMGFSMLQVIAAGAGLLLVCVIIAAVVVLKGGGDDEAKEKSVRPATVAFENPMYEQTAGIPDAHGVYNAGGGEADDLYDEPEIVTSGKANVENPAYTGDDEGDASGMYAESGALAGGYLDMDPDDNDDDDDDDDEEEEEDESEDDDEDDE